MMYPTFWIWLVAAAVSLAPQPARANGRLPGATELTVNRSDPNHLIARATFGMVQSFDRGQTWQWICERAISVSGEADPPIAITEDDTIVLLPPASGTLISRDRGCSWAPAPAPLRNQRAVDLTVDTTQPARVLVLLSSVDSIDARGVVSYANKLIETRDNAHTWSEVSPLPTTFFAETLEISASDPSRIYVGGTSNMDPSLGIVQRSEDGGKTWAQSSVKLPPGTGSMFISAIDPAQPDRLWVRLPARGDRFGILPVTLIMSSDKGMTWRTLAATERQAMLGIALSPDGTRLAYGGPGDGLYVGASDGSEGFNKVTDVRVRCLRWYRDGLYACGTESTRQGQAGDPFSVGISVDEGRTFRPIYTMADTCPQACPDATGFAQTCRDVWSALAPTFAASGEGCAVPWSRLARSDAGASDAGASDAGAMDAGVKVTSEASGEKALRSGCTAAVGGARPPTTSALLMTLVLVCIGFRRVALAAILSLVGCADAEQRSYAAHTSTDAGAYVACPKTIPDFTKGVTFAGRDRRIRVELVDASHVPARKYRNQWLLGLADHAGETLVDAKITRLEAFMPVHGHFSRPPADVEPREQSGQFDVTIHFTMRGPWEVQIEAQSETAGDDYVVLDVCVED